MRRLLLHCPDTPHGKTAFFPEKFDRVEYGTTPSGTPLLLPRATVEERVLIALNMFKDTLEVANIDYVDINQRFSEVQAGCYTGVIVDDFSIDSNKKEEHKADGDYVYLSIDGYRAQSIFAYVFVSPSKADSRNSFVSQTIFPELFEYMERFIGSPSFGVANHPVFFLNIVWNPIKAPSTIRDFIGLEAMGIHYIDVFGPSFDPDKDMPTDLSHFVADYYGKIGPIVTTDYFEVEDFLEKKFSFVFNKFILHPAGILDQAADGTVHFHGSNEKFFVMSALPAAMMAVKERFEIDLSSFETFCENNGHYKFKPDDVKFNRMISVYKYIKKIVERMKHA